MTDRLDAVVVGAGPNGLAAAITLARAGLAVRVFEAADRAGGGLRSSEVTLPGFVHDICATVMGTNLVSPFFQDLDLARYGVEFVAPSTPLGHGLDDGRAVLLERSVDATAEGLGRDGPAYRRLFGPLVRDADRIIPWLLGPVLRPPRHPIAQARFGIPALASATTLARAVFRTDEARALFGGLAGHSMLPLRQPATASFGLALGVMAHVTGWPVVRGGSGRLADALVAELRSLGGEIELGRSVTSLDELPPARATLLSLTPRQVVAIAGERLPRGYCRRLAGFRYGPGVCKVDWALSGPVPWRAPQLGRAGTLHLGGTIGEIEAGERAAHRGSIPERPYLLFVQATRFDPSRAPEGGHTAWAYCHVPNGSTVDATAAMEAQVERFAPGFRDLIVGRATKTASAMEAWDANYVGGDINGGVQDLRQLFARPVLKLDPYSTPVRGLYLCSSSTPPGGGVHGMSGVNAARSALKRELGIRV